MAPLGSGIGDVIVGLPIIDKLIASGVPVILVARGPRQIGFEQRIEGLSGVVREVDLQSLLQVEDTYLNIRDHEIQKNYDWFGEKFAQDFPGYLVNDIMREICKSFGLDVDFSVMSKLKAHPIASLAGKVAIVPGTTIDFKSWPVSMWLSWSNLREQGLELIMLGEPERSTVVSALLEAGVHWYPTESIGDAIDAISSVSGVIAVDTGLMHIAVQQGIPTVALMNFVHTYLRPSWNCRPLIGARCAPECAFVCGEGEVFTATYPEWIWWDGEFNYCKAEKPCMGSIRAEQVLEAFHQVRAATAPVTA